MYKVFTPIISVTLAAGVALLLGNIGLFFVSFDTVPAQVVSHLTLSALALIVIFGIGCKAVERYNLKKKIVRKIKNILIADLTSDGSGTKFANNKLLDVRFGHHLEFILAAVAYPEYKQIIKDITEKSFKPYVLVLIKDKGDVTLRHHGKKLRARGFSHGDQCEIESLNFTSTYRLMQHELGHIMLKNTSLGRSAYKHHKIMTKAGF